MYGNLQCMRSIGVRKWYCDIGREEVINAASKLLRASKTLGLCVNGEKTKYLMVARKSPATDHIIVDKFKNVEVFKYLGANK